MKIGTIWDKAMFERAKSRRPFLSVWVPDSAPWGGKRVGWMEIATLVGLVKWVAVAGRAWMMAVMMPKLVEALRCWGDSLHVLHKVLT